MDLSLLRRAFLCSGVALVVGCGAAESTTVPSTTAPPAASAVVISASPAAVVSPPPATTQPGGPAPTVRILGNEPVLRGLGGPPGYAYVLPGAAIEHDGVTHAWLVWFADEPGKQVVTHAQSADGRTWTIDDSPAYTDLDLGFQRPGPIPADVLVQPDGTWAMYGWGEPAQAARTFVSWRATAPGPDGPWSAQRILPLADAGGWDDNTVAATSVVVTPAGLEMYYEGASRRASSTYRIGLARSEDGVAWMRVSPPGADAGGGPVFEPGQCAGLGRRSTTMPNVTLLPGGRRLMLTTGFDGNEAAVGAATSVDGLIWECAGAGPVLERTDVPGSQGLHTLELFERTSGPTLLIESLGDGSSDVWLAEVVLP
jgi:hypothetical protein